MIRTYNTESFRDKFMEQEIESLLHMDFGKFLVVRVEEMLRLIKLPVPPTRAVTHTLIYLTEGEAIMSIGSETYTIYAHECLLVPAGQVFAFSNLDVNKGFLCNFHDDFIVGRFARPELLQYFEFLQVWGNPRIHLGETVSGQVHLLFQRLLSEYTANGLKNPHLLQAYFVALLCEIQQVYQPLSSSSQVKSVAIANQFKALLFANIRSKHLVSDYAAMLFITPNHLNKTVKQITGKSPTKWIDETLVLEAKVLLFQTDYSVAQVAAEIGVTDASYFSRLFKKYEGITPMAFRKMIEKS